MDTIISLFILIVVLFIAFKMMRWDGPVCPNCEGPVSRAKLAPVHQDRRGLTAAQPGHVFFFDQPGEGAVRISGTGLATASPTPTTVLPRQPEAMPNDLILDSDADGVYGLLALDLDGQVSEAAFDDELILDEEIGLGTMGLSMASQLVQAGFAVTTSPQKWRRDSKRLDLTMHDDADTP